jgi:hypothetical protein
LPELGDLTGMLETWERNLENEGTSILAKEVCFRTCWPVDEEAEVAGFEMRGLAEEG